MNATHACFGWLSKTGHTAHHRGAIVECGTTVPLWIPATRVAGSFRYRTPGVYVIAVVIPPELAFGQLKRYLLHCVQPYRTPKATRERNEIQSGARLAALRKWCRNILHLENERGVGTCA